MLEDPGDDDLLLSYLDPYFGSAIADVISSWARFEYRIDEAIWRLAGLEPEAGACITCQLTTVASRFSAFTALAQMTGWEDFKIKKLNKLKDKAFAIAEKRNRVAHDPWFMAYKSKNHYRLQKTAKGRLEYVYKIVPEAELMQIRNDAEALSVEFDSILRQNGPHSPSEGAI
jgi:hypothetical protein